jgi:hypothetical protein
MAVELGGVEMLAEADSIFLDMRLHPGSIVGATIPPARARRAWRRFMMLLADRAGEPMERDAVIMTADACPHNGELAPLPQAGAIWGYLGLAGFACGRDSEKSRGCRLFQLP